MTNIEEVKPVILEISISNTGDIVYSIEISDIMFAVGRVAHYFGIGINRAIKAIDDKEIYGYGSYHSINIKETK